MGSFVFKEAAERNQGSKMSARANPGSTWRKAHQSVSTGNQISDSLKRELGGPSGKRVNQLLLESCKRTPLTRDLSPEIIKYIKMQSLLKGRRAEAIAKSLKSKLPNMTQNQLESISATIIMKAHSALTEARSEMLDLPWYQWLTSRDVRVRKSHRLMDGVLVRWNDAPDPEALNGEESSSFYHAGEAEGCRCIAASLISLNEVKWPCRAHFNGKIIEMSKKQFIKKSGWKDEFSESCELQKRKWYKTWWGILLLIMAFILIVRFMGRP